MGTALRPIANHQIAFGNRLVSDVAREVEQMLNQLRLPDPAFLYACASDWYANRPDMQVAISRQHWQWLEDSSFDYSRDQLLEFEGPFALTITVSEHQLEFWNPPFRYRQWFCLQMQDGSDPAVYQRKWREYYQKVVYALGGNRLLYAADNTHPLEKYTALDGDFSAMEKALYEDMGPPKGSFAEICADDSNGYFLDFFPDLL
jgi:hypothetical protein